MSNCFGTHPGDAPSSSNLIVNYLPQKLNDQEFYDLFAKIGKIKTCKIVRNKQTGYSYGFGFVDYHDPGDAQNAIAEFNGFQMHGKTLKVAIAKPSNSNHSKNTNVYIRGIPKSFDPNELENMFASFGRLVQFRVLRDTQSNINKGVAFALYDEKENADRAIQEMDGKTLAGCTDGPLQVKIADDQMKLKKHRAMTYEQHPQLHHHQHPQIRPGGGPMHARPPFAPNIRPSHRFNPMNKGPNGYQAGYGHNNQAAYDMHSSNGASPLFVYNIGLETDDNSLLYLFSQYGLVEKAAVVKDKMTGKSKGYGFVTMPNYNEAVWAIDQLNGFIYAGKPLQVSFKTTGKQGGGPLQGGPMGGFMDHTGGYDSSDMSSYMGTGYPSENAGYGHPPQPQDMHGKRPFY